MMNIENELEKLTKRLDSSFYFYDLDALEEHLKYIVDNKDESIKLYYACKANPLSSILKLIRNLGIGVDVASKGELSQVVASGVKPQDIISTGPSKSRGYIRSLLNHEINCVVVESIYQLKWLNEQASELGIKARCLLRVQLEWDSNEKSVLGGDDITAFGLDEEGWQSVNLSEYQNVEVIGFHVFQWGNILEASRLELIWDHTCKRIDTLAKNMGIEAQVIDLGGGLGIPYQNESARIDFKDINKILMKLKDKYQLSKIWMELGRYAVGECGLYLSQVIDRKRVRGQDILVLDGGINHIARPALTDQAFPCRVLARTSNKTKAFHVHGPLCTSLDKLGIFELPEDCDYGDWLVFSQCGAYGFTESMPFFLCHNLAAEVVKYKGDIMTPRTIKTSDDWIE